MLNDDLIKKIDDLIDSGVKVPGFGKKVMIDTAKIDKFLINWDIPSGPNLSIIEPSIFFQWNFPNFLEGITNM